MPTAVPPSSAPGRAPRRRAAATSVGVALVAALTAGCGSGTQPHASESSASASGAALAGSPSAAPTPPAAPSSAAAPSSPSSSPPVSIAPLRPSGHPLSRSAFVARANSMCRAENAQLTRVGQKLTGLSSVDGFVDGIVAVLTSSAQAFTALVAVQPDHLTLQSRWLMPRLSDYVVQQRQLVKLRADADRGDGAAAQRDLTGLQHLPNHNKAVNAFLRSYGLTACA